MSVQGAFEKRCLTAGAPTELSFITTSLSMVFTLTSIPGNILIILAVVLDPNKNLRSPFNWLVVNLATADLIVGAVTNPISVYIHMKEGLNKKITSGDVKAIHMSYFISCTASVLSLSSLALERYLAVRKPNTYRTNVTNKRIILTVACIWLISLSLPNIYFEVGYTTYAFIFANSAVAVAIVITCLTYTLMLRKVQKRSQNVSSNNDTVRKAPYSIQAPSTSGPPQDERLSTVPTNTPSSILNSARQMEAKVTRMFIVVLIAMLCCYGPSTLFIYIMNFCEQCSCITLHWFRDLQFVFVLLNSSVNFWCYAVQSPRFRSAFTKILKIAKRNNRSEESGFSDINNIQTISFSKSVEQGEDVKQGEIKMETINAGTRNKGLDIVS
ncbi:probable G-protein coupled receptor No18 [Dendronephthya gigantea]|uniref:probable G-protein coupled receptor No18 n=1 Tax=Dendronephthya gigantea TaxID=151771 RepID=UPI00106A9020|nr:probable G-protein coupled receptor No18 [Dendronephthya gigantea]XP_028407255.1 probable G-protein coupled receptor No18 [Dendronephthya gigantea]